MAERTMQLTLTTCRQHQGCEQPICPEAFSFGERRISEVVLRKLLSKAKQTAGIRPQRIAELWRARLLQ